VQSCSQSRHPSCTFRQRNGAFKDILVMQRATNLALVRAVPVRAEAASERRAHERHAVSALAWLNQVRLKYGPTVSLIDLSVCGAQIDVSQSLQPGTTVVIEIAGRKGDVLVPSRVVRCHVSDIAPSITYRGALEFKQPFALPEAPANSVADADANMLHEHARLTVALKRQAESSTFAPSAGQTCVGAASLAAALAMIESPSGRRAGGALPREVGRLFRTLTRSIETGQTVDKLLAEVADQLRRTVPTRSIRLIDAGAPMTFHTKDAIALDVPSALGQEKKLLVEFPRGCQLEAWHLQLLKTAVHLVALINEVEASRHAAEEEPMRRAAQGHVAGWHRMVARYRDGRTLKGYGRDFFPAKGQVQIEAVPNGPPASRITVHLAHLKAVFFVHDFDGLRLIDPRETLNSSGRPIAVTFLDGEVLTGTTLNYSADGPGFFVSPEENTNNHRIFVVGSAVQRVEFP
jgi:uncharacterized protein DUF6982/PilZ domain-containing protein